MFERRFASTYAIVRTWVAHRVWNRRGLCQWPMLSRSIIPPTSGRRQSREIRPLGAFTGVCRRQPQALA